MVGTLHYVSIKPCFDDLGRTTPVGTMVIIPENKKVGYCSNLEYMFSLRQLRNQDFFREVPGPEEEKVTVTVLISGRKPFMKQTYTVPSDKVGEKVCGLLEYLKEL
jgi:hypothetical protein